MMGRNRVNPLRVPPADPASAHRPDEPCNAVAADDGAGPSRLDNSLNGHQEPDMVTRSANENKINGIRAALQYNGYPSDVIEELIQNKLFFHLAKGKSFYLWKVYLPNVNLLIPHSLGVGGGFSGGN